MSQSIIESRTVGSMGIVPVGVPIGSFTSDAILSSYTTYYPCISGSDSTHLIIPYVLYRSLANGQNIHVSRGTSPNIQYKRLDVM